MRHKETHRTLPNAPQIITTELAQLRETLGSERDPAQVSAAVADCLRRTETALPLGSDADHFALLRPLLAEALGAIHAVDSGEVFVKMASKADALSTVPQRHPLGLSPRVILLAGSMALMLVVSLLLERAMISLVLLPIYTAALIWSVLSLYAKYLPPGIYGFQRLLSGYEHQARDESLSPNNNEVEVHPRVNIDKYFENVRQAVSRAQALLDHLAMQKDLSRRGASQPIPTTIIEVSQNILAAQMRNDFGLLGERIRELRFAYAAAGIRIVDYDGKNGEFFNFLEPIGIANDDGLLTLAPAFITSEGQLIQRGKVLKASA